MGYRDADDYGIKYLATELTLEIHDRSVCLGDMADDFARALGVKKEFLFSIERAFVESGLPCSCELCAGVTA
jgi:hypothetical protein